MNQSSYTEFTARGGWDKIGFSASTLCAIHCAVTPLIVMALPFAGSQLLASPILEVFMIAVSAIIGLLSLVTEYLRHHRKIHALVVLAFGFALIGDGMLIGGEIREIMIPSGGFVVALSHGINWRLCRKSKNCIREVEHQ